MGVTIVSNFHECYLLIITNLKKSSRLYQFHSQQFVSFLFHSTHSFDQFWEKPFSFAFFFPFFQIFAFTRKRKNLLMEFKWREKFARPLRLAPLNHSCRLDSSFRRYDFKARFFVRLFKIAGIPRINSEADEILFIL